jgi:hypothetical protein
MIRIPFPLRPLAALIALATVSPGAPAAAETPAGPSVHDLEVAQDWLLAHPPDGKNAAERRKRMATIQQACDRLPAAEYREYMRQCAADPAAAARAEQRHPALHALRRATARAMGEIRRTRVSRGLAVWQLYNVGHVFRTPRSCFGIDIKFPGSAALADDLDFLLITHEHDDHWDEGLIRAMLARGKPVVTRWFPGTTIPKEGGWHEFEGIRVKIDIGDHNRRKPDQLDNMLMFEVHCGAAADDAVVYHSGDGNNFLKMRPSAPVDLFIPHVKVGMSIPDAIAHMKPKLTLVSHVLELGHELDRWRWSYDDAFGVIRGIPEASATVLVWGERILLPGTKLAAADQVPGARGN